MAVRKFNEVKDLKKVIAANNRRPIIARDGSVYFLRRLANAGGAKAIYVPDQMMKTLKWDTESCLMIWLQGDVMCIQAIDPPELHQKLIPVPPRGKKKDTVTDDSEL